MDKATPTPASVESVMAKAMMLVGALDDSCEEATSLPFLEAVTALRAEVERLAAQAAPTDTEMVLVPPWKGYALLGTGNYILNSSAAPPDPKLGAEFFITFATDADKSGNRQVGETRANDPNAAPVQPEEMVLRIGFLTPQALCALEGQLRVLREENFPESVAAQPSQAPVVQAMQPTQAVRMLTDDEQAAIIDMHSTGRAQGDHECAEAIQRKFCEVNKLPAPADGVIGGV